MKKICFILRSHPAVSLGGAELQSLCIAEEFARRGWDVHYISEYKGKFPFNDHKNGVIPHWVKARATGSGFLNFAALSRLLNQIKPDVIYQRAATDYTGIVRFLAKRHQVRYLWAASSDKDCHKAKYRDRGARQKNVFNRLIQTLKFWSSDSLISYGIRGADIAVVQSEDQQALLLGQFGKASTVVKNGWPLLDYYHKKTNMPTVLWVGNIKRVKRVDLFIDLARACQNLPAKFIIIGRDSKNGFLGNFLRYEQIENLDYFGALDVKQTEKYIGRAYLLVNTSDYEGFPNTFIQAWMRRTPVVSLNVDPDGVIKRHQLGFHSDTLPQLISDVKLLLVNCSLRKQMGENAYRYVAEEHNIEKTADSLERLIARTF